MYVMVFGYHEWEDGEKEDLYKLRNERNAVMQTRLEERWKGSQTGCRVPSSYVPGPEDLKITFNKSRLWQDL
jgi:hypothetical protein